MAPRQNSENSHAGSKPLSNEELAHTLAGKAPAVRRIARSYPLPLDRAALLKAAGVAFVDLALVFSEQTETP